MFKMLRLFWQDLQLKFLIKKIHYLKGVKFMY